MTPRKALQKIIILICFLAILSLIPAVASATGTTASATPVLVESVWTRTPAFLRVTLTFTADGANAFKTHVTGTDDVYSYAGLFLYAVVINGNHAGTEATENCDITITDDGVSGDDDLLFSAGANQVDNTADRTVRANINGTDSLRPVIGNLTVNVDASTENVVASAAVYVTLIFIIV